MYISALKTIQFFTAPKFISRQTPNSFPAALRQTTTNRPVSGHQKRIKKPAQGPRNANAGHPRLAASPINQLPENRLPPTERGPTTAKDSKFNLQVGLQKNEGFASRGVSPAQKTSACASSELTRGVGWAYYYKLSIFIV